MRVELPSFLYGRLDEVLAACREAGVAWGAEFVRHGKLRPPKLVELEPGTVVWLDQGGANVRFAQPLWRVHLVDHLGSDFRTAVAPDARAGVRALIERLEGEWPWWNWLRAINHERPNSAAIVAARIERLMGQWSAFDQVRYAILAGRQLTFEGLMRQVYAHVLEMWVPSLTPEHGRPLPEQLKEAAAAMARASHRELVQRLAARLRRYAESVPQARNATAGWGDESFMQFVEGLDPDRFADVSSGYPRGMLSIVHSLGR